MQLPGNGDAICAAAENGAGVTRLPTFIAADPVRSGRLEIILSDYDCTALGIYVLYSSSRHQTAKLRALIDFLVEEISDPPGWDEGIFTR